MQKGARKHKQKLWNKPQKPKRVKKAKGRAYYILNVVFSVFISVCCWGGKLMPLLWLEGKPRVVWHVFESEA
ncbi:MAG: hypothetical protein COB15_17380 [Flavobacteriales bacterium]|nr:MAG: hypothetical protein COB15_17380 [Flavobacteriales bacterium]